MLRPIHTEAEHNIKQVHSYAQQSQQDGKGIRHYEYTLDQPQTREDLRIAITHAIVALGGSSIPVMGLSYLITHGNGIASVLLGVGVGSAVAWHTFYKLAATQQLTTESLNIDWKLLNRAISNQNEKKQKIEQSKSYSLTNRFFWEVAKIVTDEGKISRELLGRIDLSEFFEPPYCDWKKIYPLLAQDLRDRGFIRKRGQGYILTNGGKECFGEWASFDTCPYAPAPPTPQEGKLFLI